MSVTLKEGHSLKWKDLVPLITPVKQLPIGTELARLAPTKPIKDLTFDGLREESYNVTDEAMDEILSRAGLPLIYGTPRQVSSCQCACQESAKKMHSDLAHETSSEFPKCNESDSHISGYLWFARHRQLSKWLINKNRCVLVDNGFFSNIRDNLLQEEILTADEVEEIQQDNIRYEQMSRFVDKLCSKPYEIIEKCCEVIREADRMLYDQLQWPCPPSPDQVHQTQVHGQMSDDLGKIQQELKSWYSRQLSHFNPIPWCGWLEMDLDHVYTNLKVVKGLKHHLSSRVGPKSGSHIDVDDTEGLLELLFSQEDRAVTFIEGSAGIGKSMLCRRLAYLWATNSSRIHGRNFDLVLLVEARSVLGDNLKQSIVKQLFPKDYDMNEEAISECITTCGENCLLIIDGVDELTQEGKMEVEKLLEGRLLRHTNIILTGRTESVQGFIKYVSVHLKVCGFTRENVKSYICKYFPQRHEKLKHAVFASLHFLTQDGFLYRPISDDEVFGELGGESDYDSIEEKRDDKLGVLCVNPFTICLMCLLVEGKGGNVPSNEHDVLEEVITLTLDRYVSKYVSCDRNKRVTTEELLRIAKQMAWIGFSGMDLHFQEEDVKNFNIDGLGEHLIKSGLMNRDFTMSRFHTSGYCYFPHRSIQDYLCAKYLVNIPQTDLDEILMDLPLRDGPWWVDMVTKLLYQLKGQRKRLRRSLLCILEKCPVYRKLKPGFQEYVGRVTSEERMEHGNEHFYQIMTYRILRSFNVDIVLSILSASDEMLRLSSEVIYVQLDDRSRNLLALPVLCSHNDVNWDWDNYARHHDFKTEDFSLSYEYRVEHKISHVYVSFAQREWSHFDSFRDIAEFFKWKFCDLPIVLSVLVLPGCMDVLLGKWVIDTLNSAKRKLTLFLIVPQLQCEDLSRMRLLSMIRSGVGPNIQVCCKYPNVPVRLKYTNRTVCRERVYLKVVEIKYSHPVAVHHMYYNKYCPF